ncbi:hypothetical protein AAUPMB_13311, partial [Pasteurella multocida subsp. multocida str. Anand1_buffalo]
QSADLLKSDVNSIVEKIQQLQDKAKSRERIASLKGKARCKRVPIWREVR